MTKMHTNAPLGAQIDAKTSKNALCVYFCNLSISRDPHLPGGANIFTPTAALYAHTAPPPTLRTPRAPRGKTVCKQYLHTPVAKKKRGAKFGGTM